MYHHQPIKRSKDGRGPTLGVRGSAVFGKREKNLWLLKREDFLCHLFFLLKELPLYSAVKRNGIDQKKKSLVTLLNTVVSVYLLSQFHERNIWYSLLSRQSPKHFFWKSFLLNQVLMHGAWHRNGVTLLSLPFIPFHSQHTTRAAWRRGTKGEPWEISHQGRGGYVSHFRCILSHSLFFGGNTEKR